VRQRTYTLYAYPYLPYDREAKEKVTRLGKDGIGESRVEDVRVSQKAETKILLRN
jgi:hypothetical protein